MIRKIVLLPIYIVLTVLRIVIDLMLRISTWIFYLIGGVLLLTTIGCYYFQIESGENIRNMLIGTGVFFIIPQAVTILAGMVEVAAEIVGNRLKSV